MTLPERPNIAAWMAKAQADLRMVEFACSDDARFWDQACFHSQQAAEKALKALLLIHDRAVERVHDLTYLIKAVEDIVSFSEDLVTAAELLNAYAVAPRYPSFLAPETEEDADHALASARQIVAFVQDKIEDTG